MQYHKDKVVHEKTQEHGSLFNKAFVYYNVIDKTKDSEVTT